MLIRLPDPCLVVLVGAAGSGKSTLAARLFASDAVLSSDAHRAIVSGHEADQAATRAAFSILHRRLAGRLSQSLTSVVDATNVESYARRALVRRAAERGMPAVAIVLDLEPRIVLARNATRPGRIVPASAVERQLDNLERSLRRGLELDGFDAVHVIRSPADLDTVAVEWVRPPTPPR